MDALLEPLRDFAEGQIVSHPHSPPVFRSCLPGSQDFRGQHLTELLNTLLLGLTAVYLCLPLPPYLFYA